MLTLPVSPPRRLCEDLRGAAAAGRGDQDQAREPRQRLRGHVSRR